MRLINTVLMNAVTKLSALTPSLVADVKGF